MDKTTQQTLYISVIGILMILLISFAPLIRSIVTGSGSSAQRLRADTVTTSGKVIRVGPSTHSDAPAVVIYSYDVPGYPRNGNPGSFQREQIITPEGMQRFRSGAPVDVEYSRGLPGVSRLKGYGTGSVYVAQQAEDLKHTATRLIPALILGLVICLLLKLRAGRTQ